MSVALKARKKSISKRCFLSRFSVISFDVVKIMSIFGSENLTPKMKAYIKIILILLIPLGLIVGYSLWGGDWGMRKIKLPKWTEEIRFFDFAQNDSKANIQNDTLPICHPERSVTEPQDTVALDTANQRILFIGDSMLEGLSRRLCDYCMENGHELTTVIWYSSTSQQWAETDTLEHFMRKTDPTFIFVCLCSNELFVRDLDERDKWLKEIVGKMGDTPFVWVSPPNWREDTGINDLIIKNVGTKRYFDSRNLTLRRGRDKVHPTFKAAEAWMDSIAVWVTEKSAHPIKLETPKTKRKREYKLHILTQN